MPLFYKAVQSPIANKAGAKLWHLNLVKAGGTVATRADALLYLFQLFYVLV